MCVGTNEVTELKDFVHGVKEELLAAINKVNLSMAKNYVSKEDFNQYKQEQGTSKRTGITNVIMSAGIIISMVIGIVGLLKGGV